ncbi:retrovirus-related pol polyprotein from transposon TNT 1-94, partial [Tanacetum coccineum]
EAAIWWEAAWGDVGGKAMGHFLLGVVFAEFKAMAPISMVGPQVVLTRGVLCRMGKGEGTGRAWVRSIGLGGGGVWVGGMSGWGARDYGMRYLQAVSGAFVGCLASGENLYALFVELVLACCALVGMRLCCVVGFSYYVQGNAPIIIQNLKKYLERRFFLKDLGRLKYFLGIEVARSKAGIFLTQRKYAMDILTDSYLTGGRISEFSMEQHLHLNKTDGTLLPDPTPYHQLVGRLIYLNVTRPDIVYFVHVLSKFMQCPRTSHMDGAFRVLRYLKGSDGKGIPLSSSSHLQISGDCDSDWAGCPITRRSISVIQIRHFVVQVQFHGKLRSTILLHALLLK